MKKLTSLILISLLGIFTLFAQAPDMFKYQTVVRNNSGEAVKNQSIALKISILQGSSNGTAVYSETHSKATNEFGLVNLEIGNGSAEIGSFPLIDWHTGLFFVKIEMDVNNVNNFTVMGTSQLLSVPYALYAKNAGNTGNINLMPSVFTNNVSAATTTSAMSGGNIVANGSTEVTGRGVCWGTGQNPTTADSVSSTGTGLGFYTSEITGLVPGTTYYIRAYATNSSGTSYGNQVIFETPLNVVFPTVTTAAAINITEYSAASGGNVTELGGAVLTAKGICWSTNKNPTVADSKTAQGTDSGQFDSQMDNLLPGSTYYVRAYATNSSGTGYGAQVTLTTLKTIPTVVTKSIISITAMGGVSGGTITISGGGTISDKGICWGEFENPTVNDNKISAGTGIDAFYSAISLLKPNTTCYVRAYAVNEIGIAYGDQKIFTTLDAFYDGFETGFSGNTGGWGIVMDAAIEGAYSLSTQIKGSEASLKRTLLNSGQINFYAAVYHSYSHLPVRIDFYIDDINQGTFSNIYWGLQSYPVSDGEHTFKWIFNGNSQSKGRAWIDFIVMPK